MALPLQPWSSRLVSAGQSSCLKTLAGSRNVCMLSQVTKPSTPFEEKTKRLQWETQFGWSLTWRRAPSREVSQNWHPGFRVCSYSSSSGAIYKLSRKIYNVSLESQSISTCLVPPCVRKQCWEPDLKSWEKNLVVGSKMHLLKWIPVFTVFIISKNPGITVHKHTIHICR